MFYFPLINIFFLILIYRVHRPLFWTIGIIEVALYISGVLFIEANYELTANKFLFYLSLTGVGLFVGVAGFLLAISLNQRHLYKDMNTEEK